MKASSSFRNKGLNDVTVELVGTLGYHAQTRELNITIHDPTTIGALIKRPEVENEILGETLIDRIQARRDVLILVSGREISVLDGLATVVKGGDRVTLLPVSHGG